MTDPKSRWSDRKTWTMGILAALIVASFSAIAKQFIPPSPSELINPEGYVYRTIASSECTKSSPIDILQDGSVKIGLQGTTTGSTPRKAKLFIYEESYSTIEVLENKVTSFKAKGINFTIVLTEIGECKARYKIKKK